MTTEVFHQVDDARQGATSASVGGGPRGGVPIAGLCIDRLRVERFGGTSDATIELGEGLVVVHGPNESGKSTLATLLSWLLVGPIGTGAEAHRFGRPGDRVGGRFEGRLGEHAVRSEATFKLLQRGLPNPSAMSVTVGDTTMDLDRWRHVLGGVDARVFDAVYRMSGATLHDADDLLTEVAQVALAGLTGSRRVHLLGEHLGQEAHRLLTSRAQGVDSWQRLTSLIGTADAEIRRLALGADAYRRAGERIEELSASISSARDELRELVAESTSLELAASVAGECGIVARTTLELDELDDVPERWRTIVADVDGLRAAIGRADDAAAQADRSAADLRRTAAAIGLREVGDDLAVTHRTVANVQVALAELDAAHRRHGEAVADRDTAARAVATADDQAGAARAACPALSADALDAGLVDHAGLAELRRTADELRVAEGRATDADDAHLMMRSRVEQAERRSDVAQAAWARFGAGCTAQQWMTTPPAPVAARAAASTWAFTALAVSAAIISVLVLPRPVGALATIGAIGVVAALVWRRPGPSRAAGPDDPADDIAAAAAEVIAADDALDHAHRDLARTESELRRAGERIETCRTLVGAVCRPLGIEPPASADALSRLIEAITQILDAGTALASNERALLEAEHRVDRCAIEVGGRVAAVQTLLTGAGVPVGPSWRDAAEQIDVVRRLTELRTEHAIATTALEAARAEIAEILEPLGADRHPEPRVDLAQAETWAELGVRRVRLMAERTEAERAITVRLRHDEQAGAIVAAELSETEIRDRLATARQRRDELQTRIDALLDERGQLTEQRAQLEGADEVAAARLALGELQARADERLWQGAVHVVARALLSRTAAERRRTHQPALVARAGELLHGVAGAHAGILIDPDETGSAEVNVIERSGLELPLHRMSTGARALVLLALRLATAELDAERRGVRVPIVCDDPLVHLDDDRAAAVMPLLARAADDGHQVLVFTCHRRTVESAAALGARTVTIGR